MPRALSFDKARARAYVRGVATRLTILAAAERAHGMLGALSIFACGDDRGLRIENTRKNLHGAIELMLGSDEEFLASLDSVGSFLTRVEFGRLSMGSHRRGTPEQRTRTQLGRVATLWSQFEQAIEADQPRKAASA